MTTPTTIRRRISPFFLTLLFLTLTACATVPESREETTTSPSVLLDKARNAADNGDYAIAARLFQELAATPGEPARIDYLLGAAESFWRGGLNEQARRILLPLHPESLDAQQLNRRQVVMAAIALQEHNPRAALDTLNLISQPATPTLQASVYELRATAHYQLGNFLESTRERVALAPLLIDQDKARRNEQLLWQGLMSLSGSALEESPSTTPNTLSGWLELAALAKSALTEPAGMDARIAAWRKKYPNHPASEDLMASLLAQQPERLRSRPAHIALLLPLTGTYAKSAEAVRDGFLGAYYLRINQDYQPIIQSYDSSATTDIAALYEQAVQDGAQFIVGPLEKEAISTLRKRNAVTVPTLALNYTDSDDATPAELYQFGLAPEDEARMVAERAWLDGHQNALAIIPEGDWGGRIFRAFADYWQQLGGKVVATQTYAAANDDLSEPLGHLLNIDASEARARALRSTLQTDIKFEAWRRHDVDFIFMAAFPRQARQIPPQLKFLYAGDLPIYTTSHAYAGRIDQSKDRDLDGVMFIDIPWLLKPKQFPLRDQTRSLWPDTADQFARLYALGADAYDIIPYLQALRNSPFEEYPGATGRLVMEKNNRIRRTLSWARFSGGIPRLLSQSAAAP